MSMLGQIMQQQVFVQSGWYQRQSGILLPLEVRQILEKYQATMLLPGVRGELRFSYQPGNYRESTGQTLAATDQQVGLVVDAARVPGPELVTNGDFSNGVSSWVYIGSGSFAAPAGRGVLTLPAVIANRNDRQAHQVRSGLVVGKSYLLVANAELGSGVTQARVNVTDTVETTDSPPANIIFAASGTQSVVFTATSATMFLRCMATTYSGGGVVSFDSISLRELPGIHASQSTSGFQPVLRNASGIQSWQFDGTDDRLSLSAVPFQTQDVSFAITAFNPSVSDGTVRRLWEIGGNGSETTLGVTANAVQYLSKGDTGLQANILAGGYGTVGASRVASAVSRGSSMILRIDGVVRGSSSTAVSNSTANVATLGNRAAGDRAYSGFIHGAIFGKGAISDSELLTLERFAVQLQGRQL